MHKALNPRDDVDGLYVSRKEGGREFASIQDRIVPTIQRLEEYVKSAGEGWLQPAETILTTQASTDKNKRETKMERKTTVWSFHVTNKQNLTWENLEMAKKRRS